MLGKHKHHHATRDFDGITDNRAQGIPWYFTALFYGLVIWGVLYMGYFLFSGWTQEGEFEQKMAAYETSRPQTGAAPAAAAQPSREERLAAGATLFGERCRACHGDDGKGGVGPDLTRATYGYGRNPEAVAQTIRSGRPGGMPAYGNRLSADEIQAVVTYVLSLE
jgi:cytochrome c oxidase cbb3-type subunit 3